MNFFFPCKLPHWENLIPITIGCPRNWSAEDAVNQITRKSSLLWRHWTEQLWKCSSALSFQAFKELWLLLMLSGRQHWENPVGLARSFSNCFYLGLCVHTTQFSLDWKITLTNDMPVPHDFSWSEIKEPWSALWSTRIKERFSDIVE